ncbi:hypothetical protein ACFVRU_40100, partial [Streptomyces sp. NPDC057927]
MLFSSKGKHRRPSKATRVATLAGVTGVAIAAPLMAAGNASAATTSEWDAVAQRLRLLTAGLDAWAADNILSYLDEQRRACGHVPDDRTVLVER